MGLPSFVQLFVKQAGWFETKHVVEHLPLESACAAAGMVDGADDADLADAESTTVFAVLRWFFAQSCRAARFSRRNIGDVGSGWLSSNFGNDQHRIVGLVMFAVEGL